MKSPALGLRVASILFGLAALGQFLRVLTSLHVMIGTCYVQRRWSLVAFVILAALCVWLWRLACQLQESKPEAPKT